MKDTGGFAVDAAGRSAGFTLVELIFVLLIVSVLLIVAVPNYDSVIIGSKVDKARFAIATSLAFARTEAIKRGEDIQLCRGSGGSCGTASGSTDWSGDGWKVVVDSSNEILRTDESDTPGVTINYGCGDFISFGGNGQRTSSGTAECQFSFGDAGGDSSFDKSLWIAPSGRVRMN